MLLLFGTVFGPRDPLYYETPGPAYVTPQDSYTAASYEYASPSYTVRGYDGSSYAAPSPSYGVGGSDGTFQTSFYDQVSIENIRPPRDGGIEECYCVPQGQCPANKIVSNTFKDYSNLINPRNKNSNPGISSFLFSLLSTSVLPTEVMPAFEFLFLGLIKFE